MSVHASTYHSTDTDSTQAAAAAALAVGQAFGTKPLRALLVYATIAHDHMAILRTLRARLGPDVLIFGCSVQGVMANGIVREGGYLLGIMGLGGDSLKIAAAVERDIGQDTRTKGSTLALQVKARLGEEPKICIVLYDPLCGAESIRCSRELAKTSAVPSLVVAQVSRSGPS